ncbi:hypothetical protein F4009_13570, partial [Candidatus Poribacteria bacterium]|nr:hypothetical protein [Candidatus Poribacteria bacterium]
MFKSIFGFLLCLCTIMFASLSFAELTPQDLKEIRLIVKEEIDKELTPIKADIVSLKEGFARLDARLTGVEKQIAMVANLVFALIALIVVAVGIPQIIMTWRSRKESASEMQIAALIQEQSKMLSSSLVYKSPSPRD